MRDIVEAYEKWLKENHPESPNLKMVKTYLKEQDKPTPSHSVKSKSERRKSPKYQKNPNKKTYGKPLYFRNMIHAPSSEQGVVFLFGMVSEELGFSIEGVWQDFPDCKAKRTINHITGEQQDVWIEFEPKSRDFDHDPKKCDLIVCWKDNWPDCPIEVLELSKAIKNLPKTKK